MTKQDIINAFRELKMIDAPDEKEFGKLPKRQVFMAGQINVLMRIKMLADKLQKDLHPSK